MTTLERLVRSANHIAANLATDPDPTRATAQHIADFWDPRMKAMIKAHDGSGLSAIAAAAIATFHESA
ncbi:MAG: formate dehydrogenase subunit delta [Sphingomonadaceae bacterium]